eukprot:1158038-Pelagomonas_calceolata.AAC.3
MSHVYAVDQGLGLQNETVDAVHYDDATSLLLIIKVGHGPERGWPSAAHVWSRRGSSSGLHSMPWLCPVPAVHHEQAQHQCSASCSWD